MRKFLTAILLVATSLTAAAQVEQNYNAPNLQMSYRAYESGDYETAYKYAFAEYQSNPTNHASYLLLSDLLFIYADEREQGLIILDEGLRNIGKSDSVALAQLHFQKGRLYHSIKEYDHAKQEYCAAAELTPQDYVIYLNILEIALLTDNFEDAINSCERYLSKPEITSGEEADCYYYISLTYHKMREDDKALLYIEKALALQPTDSYARLCKVEILNKMGRYEEALDLLVETCLMDFTNLQDKLVTQSESNYFDETIKRYDKEKLHQDREIWDEIIVRTCFDHLRFYDAYIHYSEANADDANRILAMSLSQSYPEMQDEALQYALKYKEEGEYYHMDAHLIMSQIYLNMRSYEEAVQCCDLCLQADYTLESISPIRAYANECMGNYDAAIEDYTHSYIKSGNEVYFFQRGYLYHLMGDTVNAEADFNRILNNKSGDTNYRAIAFTHAYLGHADSAWEAVSKIEEMCIIDECIVHAAVYALLGNEEEAVKQISNAAENGFTHFDLFSYDPCFRKIRGSEKLQSLIKTYDR